MTVIGLHLGLPPLAGCRSHDRQSAFWQNINISLFVLASLRPRRKDGDAKVGGWPKQIFMFRHNID